MPGAHDMGLEPGAISPNPRRVDRGAGVRRHVQGGTWPVDTLMRLSAVTTVADDLSRLRDVVDEALADTFRVYVGTVVKAVSPLVLDACLAHGLELDTLLVGLRHDCRWRPWLCGSKPMCGIGHGARRFIDLPDHHATVPQFHRCGVVVREEDYPMGALGFRVGARCLEFAMKTEGARMISCNGFVRLHLGGSFPEKLGILLRRRPLEDIVDHPLLSGRGYTVVRAEPSRHGGVCVLFHAEPVPRRMSWLAGPSR